MDWPTLIAAAWGLGTLTSAMTFLAAAEFPPPRPSPWMLIPCAIWPLWTAAMAALLVLRLVEWVRDR